ncbi:hypothetical protein [Lysobacter sp. CFH 32150]|uniref:hypothetical protein n=1 Tax=Lysobacter sp. CFH 32150 TaxID=2927128 RepID=UPI001FA7701E|nr:hypothetical protein [Lysobacter sp. CFH 32150]MCI4567227.1 hypothetical protein [Lysobacter sp. CFH 32150]
MQTAKDCVMAATASLHVRGVFASLRALQRCMAVMTRPDELPDGYTAIPQRLPRNTTPTWEVELLISGVAVFAMLQLPGWLDDAWFALEPRLGMIWFEPLLFVYFYAKSAAVMLAATFVIHLLLRARWIALVGMDSVYPDGILWERLRIGPVQREVEQRLHDGTATAIERADNLATTVFAAGVTMATLMLSVSLLLAATFTTVQLVGSRFGFDIDFKLVLALCSLVVLIPFLLSRQLDHLYGARLRPGSLPHRTLAATLRGFARVGLGRTSNMAMALLTSHGGERRVVLLTMCIIAAATWAVIWNYETLREPNTLGNYALFPSLQADSSRTLAPAHYDEFRNPARDGAVPYIQSATVVGPYLRLVVPYQPKRDDAALRRDCPAILALKKTERSAATLDCLQRLHPVSIDGKPVALQYDLSSDSRTDRPALLAMIDVRSLAQGRHELLVARQPTADEQEEIDKNEAKTGSSKPGNPTSYRIPFWR